VAALREGLAATTLPTLRVRVQARLAAALQPALDPTRPMELAREALAAARALEDPPTLLEVLLWVGAALVDYANLDERLALAQELLDLATRQGEPLRALVAISRLALDHAEAGQLDAFDADVERMRALSVELGHPRRRWKALFLQSMQAIARGDFEESDRCLVEVQEHASVTDDPALAVTLLAHTGRRAVLFHRDDEVRRVLEEIPSIMADIPEADQVLGCVRAGALAHLEDVAGTARELPRLRGLPLAATDLRVLLCEAVALCGDQAQRQGLHAQLLPEAHRHSVSGHVEMNYQGPVLRLLGLLGLSLGRTEEALAQLEEARRGARTRGHRLWVAQLSYEVGRASIAAGRPEEASAAFAEALTEAEALGMPGLAARTRARLQVAPAPLPRPPERVALVREGDVWRLERGPRSLRVRHNRGLELLARLVERPGEEMHVLALASDSGASLVESDAGPALDPEARRAYQERLHQLDEELEEAEARHDVAAHARLERERTALAGELTRAAGLHGRARPTASASERARVNVQRRLKDAVARIAEADAALGEFISRALHTGTYCSFRP
jgi:tetratricopeptide (TPR) repeat protein